MTVLGPLLVRNDAKFRATRTVARVAIALAIYRSERGTLPTTLSELAPTYLPLVPADPWDGKPLRWSTEKGIVWSIGSDGVDDAGIPLGERDVDVGRGDVSWPIWNGP